MSKDNALLITLWCDELKDVWAYRRQKRTDAAYARIKLCLSMIRKLRKRLLVSI